MPEPVDHAAVRSAYDTVAETYARVLPDLSFESAEDRAMIQRFATHVGTSPDGKVIDAGCGTGRLAAHLRNAGLNVTGVDLSPTMVRVAGRLNPEIEFTAGELSALPTDDGSADGVVAWYSIIHLEPDAIDAVAREFARVLRPGCAALVAFQAGSGSRTLTRAYGHDVVLRAELHNPGDVTRSFAAHGFEPLEQLVRPPRETEKQPQAVLLFRRGAGAAPAGRRPLTPSR